MYNTLVIFIIYFYIDFSVLFLFPFEAFLKSNVGHGVKGIAPSPAKLAPSPLLPMEIVRLLPEQVRRGKTIK